ncbi:metalloregulator ArsR/SmtB family transcription factor [Chlorogloeopsis sp. ULAP01]|uniref:ArsR/SmtB family transcription factor n=1 Tax=Chlorogloeopsis sp. ULAP01 TaxID=3056483 RepID=UPI0025AAE8B9|nr:metalloregulator ArsR/SmtB family transcription factor [Chlorogloeopsis sp. ULAP01]MDM9381996.1 metalloregulator ArsR/SmtB family transcription factor [Chlorogloeopsis sp. ULAP01]
MTKPKPDDICQVRCFNTDLVAQVCEELPQDEILEDAHILFSALADKSRLKILYALSNAQELCVCDVASMLGVKVAAASHHLRKLRDLKILKYRNDGKLAYYSLKDQRIGDIINCVLKQIAI